MLKLYFLTHSDTPLADTDIGIITVLKSELKENHQADISDLIEDADALIFQEDSSYKNFNYVKRLKNDPIFKQYGNKIFTINTDDS